MSRIAKLAITGLIVAGSLSVASPAIAAEGGASQKPTAASASLGEVGARSYPWCTSLTNGKLCSTFVNFEAGEWGAQVQVGYNKTGGSAVNRRFGHAHGGGNHWGNWEWQGKGSTSYTWDYWRYGCDTVVGFMEAVGNGTYRIPPMSLC
ncbi:hypothetical protein OG948_56235 (plasmid) [Embleya sp. NBC_00888]|uniref:hypothetical protein n=1 Tax=Embleya sp. NBC_00888 TaxID=2975960 RepID=UPI002F915FFE|nr:hypothetical protein OG948_56235 [Embleya sp. NBC_00888]